MDFSFPKKERVCGKKDIAALLEKGRRGGTDALRFCCLSREAEEPNRIMVSVPKRYFKRAVRRNLLKRRIRESYRTQKAILGAPGHDILFTYTSREVLPYTEIKEQVGNILGQIASWK